MPGNARAAAELIERCGIRRGDTCWYGCSPAESPPGLLHLLAAHRVAFKTVWWFGTLGQCRKARAAFSVHRLTWVTAELGDTFWRSAV